MPAFQNDRSSTGLPKLVYVLAAGIFLLGTTEFMIAGLLPEMSADLGVSVPRTGLLISGFAVGMVIGAPAMAALTLRLPRRTTLVSALVVFAAGHVLAALTTSFAVLLTARVVTAVATGAFWAVAAVAVTAAAGEAARARALGVLVGGLTVANVAGVPLGAVLGQALGWRAPFWALAILSSAAVVGVVVSVPAQAAEHPAPRLGPELVAFRDPRLWAVLLTAALAQAGVFGAFSYVSPLLTDLAGLPDAAVPLVLAVFGVGALIGSVTGGRLGDAHPRATVTVGLAGTATVLAGLALLAQVPGAAVVLLAALGLSAFAVVAPLTARVLALAGNAPTLASATATSAFNLGNAFGPWAGGTVIAAGAGPAAPAAIGAGLAAAALVLWTVLHRRDRRHEIEPAPQRTQDAPALL